MTKDAVTRTPDAESGGKIGLVTRSARKTQVILFSILVLDVALLGLAVYALLDEFGKRVVVDVPVRPPAVLTAAKASDTRVPKAPEAVAAPVSFAIDLAGGETDGISDRGGKCTFVLLADGGARLSYNVSPDEASSGYLISFPRKALAKYRAVTFMLKAETGDEVFMMELYDGKRVGHFSATRRFPARLPTAWTRVSIPVREFSFGEAEPGDEPYLAFVFEHRQGMPYQGTIDVRDVRLE